MKHVVLIAALAGAVAGAGGAMVTTVLTMPVQSPDKGGATALAGDGGGEVRQEIAALRMENERLWERVRFLEETQVAAPTRMPASAEGGGDLALLERKIQELEASLGVVDGDAAPPNYPTIVAAIEMREEQQQLQREQEREQRRLERIDERVEKLSGELGLDAVQTNQMRDVLRSETDRRDALIQRMREEGDWASGREEMRALRDEINEEVSGILTPSQYEAYQESGGNDSGRGRGFFRGADGGGRGGRGGD